MVEQVNHRRIQGQMQPQANHCRSIRVDVKRVLLAAWLRELPKLFSLDISFRLDRPVRRDFGGQACGLESLNRIVGESNYPLVAVPRRCCQFYGEWGPITVR